ncbi:hypothetical protein [Conexibacter arvalis]|uniref:DUF4233 domain-containing protein n=1 Tax=Conexibacter arvalis TaxID=912552 RepID=A0A840ILJ5_9ACTN|nr:hypothetical protein [Conexibacter arvalis]MBB4665013.1 hypothetical protein [Conexibacter arvalis]
MGQRSRKRSARSGAAGSARGAADPATRAARGARTGDATPSRSGAGTVGGSAEPPRRRRRSSEERAAEARAQLVPLADGERPGAVTVAAVVSAVLGILVIVGYLNGARVGGEGSIGGALFLTAIFLVAAWGMWRVRYWAVLGFEALLAFQLVIASLSLMVASNWWAALLCVSLIVLGGWLFWKLIRAMARIQMPERRPAR